MLKAESGPNNAGPQVGLAKLNPIEVGGVPTLCRVTLR